MSGNCAEMTASEKAFDYLIETGETVKTAAATIGKSESTGTRLVKKIKQLSLAEPRAVNTAIRSLKKIAAGKSVTKDGVEPNAQTIVAACKEFTDRAEPKVNLNKNLNVNVSISPVDLSKYKD